MRKLLLSFTLIALSATVWAADVPKKPSCRGFVSNGFWDNWEISVGAGVGTNFTTGTNWGKVGQKIGIEGNISLTKWVHPVAGFRVQLQGGRLINFEASNNKVTWPYLFAHTDLLLNFSNWAGGYREDRAYYFVPFFGFGYMSANMTESSQHANKAVASQSFAFSYGFLNKFRISPAFDFNLELKGLLVPSRTAPADLSGTYLLGASATAGFTYRFNRRGWQRGVAGYTADDIQAFQDAVSAAQLELEQAKAENARLQSDLGEARAKAAAAAVAPAVVETPQCPEPESVILYDFDNAQLSSKEKTRLMLLAEQIKAGPKNKVYTIRGYADRQTGTAEVNKRLSERRAKRVYDFLISKGINAAQLTYEGLGSTETPFENLPKANRAAVIK